MFERTYVITYEDAHGGEHKVWRTGHLAYDYIASIDRTPGCDLISVVQER